MRKLLLAACAVASFAIAPAMAGEITAEEEAYKAAIAAIWRDDPAKAKELDSLRVKYGEKINQAEKLLSVARELKSSQDICLYLRQTSEAGIAGIAAGENLQQYAAGVFVGACSREKPLLDLATCANLIKWSVTISDMAFDQAAKGADVGQGGSMLLPAFCVSDGQEQG